MSEYPAGNVITAHFAFTSRPLTKAEQQAYEAGEGLPAGTGVDPSLVYLDYSRNGTTTTLSGGSIIRAAAGEYSAELTLDTPGIWAYQGRGTDNTAHPIAATPRRVIRVLGFP